MKVMKYENQPNVCILNIVRETGTVFHLEVTEF